MPRDSVSGHRSRRLWTRIRRRRTWRRQRCHRRDERTGPPRRIHRVAVVVHGARRRSSIEPPFIKGTIDWNNRLLKTSLTIHSDKTVESHCPCYANKERGIICSHVIALGVVLVRRATDPLREQKYQEELRRALRLASVDESAYIQRVGPYTPGATSAKLKVTLASDWMEGCVTDQVDSVVGDDYHCISVPSSCAQNPTCQCLGACNPSFQCANTSSTALVCQCPTC